MSRFSIVLSFPHQIPIAEATIDPPTTQVSSGATPYPQFCQTARREPSAALGAPPPPQNTVQPEPSSALGEFCLIIAHAWFCFQQNRTMRVCQN